MNVVYETTSTATGGGRDGRVTTDQGLELDLAVPKEMGGSGGATNPEQLFASGFAACFHSALQLVARTTKTDLGESAVNATVGIGKQGQGFGLTVALEVSASQVDKAALEDLAAKAHEVCPYSNATRGNIDVTVSVA
ncbi:organic hydroperoxide resistance protein [Haloglycomyces albus]|uniref:organic hydroperoxide resistance protein n=1 Tax=Haloglycomyces albus TaxID=526067 RepID=UPI00046D3EF3|nr:organic hydroperoxide resistance protein [Haloglycomyces albus]